MYDNGKPLAAKHIKLERIGFAHNAHKKEPTSSRFGSQYISIKAPL